MESCQLMLKETKVSAPQTPFFLVSLRCDQILGVEIPGKEGFEVFNGACGGQCAQHLLQPQIGLDSVGFGGFDQRVDQRRSSSMRGRLRLWRCASRSVSFNSRASFSMA